ncbi:hypothetical protein K501DRAFT_272345 [Backusella circina FSU 941]|nr:hypothetical protein K501DRAFT_272345 [Backusella circina FSU 941]
MSSNRTFIGNKTKELGEQLEEHATPQERLLLDKVQRFNARITVSEKRRFPQNRWRHRFRTHNSNSSESDDDGSEDGFRSDPEDEFPEGSSTDTTIPAQPKSLSEEDNKEKIIETEHETLNTEENEEYDIKSTESKGDEINEDEVRTSIKRKSDDNDVCNDNYRTLKLRSVKRRHIA